ncbi:MAG TPA: N-acetyltransferase [Euryarchaeota archaeon]|nr:N-acetyltransferase [Euryarchaeota archaeon]
MTEFETLGIDHSEEIFEFCEKQGLSVDDGIDGVVIEYLVLRDEGGIAATSSIEIFEGRPFVEMVAVREDLRRGGVGREIVSESLRRLMERGYRSIWVVARKPRFFRSSGFVPELDLDLVEKLLSKCQGCDQLGTTCTPEVLRFDFR